jgi:hypothetical protein
VAASGRCGFWGGGGPKSRSSAAGKTAASAPAVPLNEGCRHSVAACGCHGPLCFVQRESRSCKASQFLVPPKFEPALNAPSLNTEPSLNDFEQQA